MPAEHADRKYVAVLAVAAGLILVLGVWARPEKRKEEPTQPAVSQAEIVRLQRLAHRRSLQDMAAYFSEVAALVAPHLVRLAGVNTTGICWGDQGTVLVPSPKGEFPEEVDVLTLDEQKVEVRGKLHSPVAPIAALEAVPNIALRPVETISPDLLFSGEWLVAVARRHEGYTFAPGTYGGSSPASCGEFEFREVITNLNLEESMLGGGLFDLDRNLVGIIVRCGDRITAMAADDVGLALDFLRSAPSQLVARYGFRIDTQTEGDETGSTEDAGQTLAVTEVWSGSAADRAGLLPFDVIQELDGEPVRSEDDLASLLDPETSGARELRIRRGSRTRTLQLEANGKPNDRAVEDSRSAGLVLSTPPTGFVIDSVTPGSRAERAGIQPGDRLLEVNGRRVRSGRELNRIVAASGGKPLPVIVERGERKRSFLLPTPLPGGE